MKEITEKKIIDLLRSGNFTIVYWDANEPTLYKGRWDIDKEYERDEYKRMEKYRIKDTWWSQGYCPEIVILLADALSGKTDSI